MTLHKLTRRTGTVCLTRNPRERNCLPQYLMEPDAHDGLQPRVIRMFSEPLINIVSPQRRKLLSLNILSSMFYNSPLSGSGDFVRDWCLDLPWRTTRNDDLHLLLCIFMQRNLLVFHIASRYMHRNFRSKTWRSYLHHELWKSVIESFCGSQTRRPPRFLLRI